MICNHNLLGLPHTTYVWCKQCGMVQDTYNGATWRPQMYDLMGMDKIELTAVEKSHCLQNQKIMAIKLLRERTGLGLREAKDAVDAYMAKNPPQPPDHPSSYGGDNPSPYTPPAAPPNKTYDSMVEYMQSGDAKGYSLEDLYR